MQACLLTRIVRRVLITDVMTIPFENQDVAEAFERFSRTERKALMQIRALIFEIAASDPKIGILEECLKWGQPAYVTPSKSGSTIRLGVAKKGGYAVFTHCQSSIMQDFRQIAPLLDYDGNRAVQFVRDIPPPLVELEFLIRRALTYRL